MKNLLLIILFVSPFLLSAQSRFTRLTLKPKETFILPSDILVADTLEMMDSSRIILNHETAENYIHVKIASFGTNSTISGSGKDGRNGKIGSSGRTMQGPCQLGPPGKNGMRGDDGESGVNLFLYIDKIIVNRLLVIDLSGGSGGDGGDGGEGGGGTAGTVHCTGGDGGKGGNGGPGGNGGNGGNLTVGGLDSGVMRMMVDAKIVINTLGGNHGYGGLYGPGGPAGLGPSKMNGKTGEMGQDGEHGKPGKNGVTQFDHQ